MLPEQLENESYLILGLLANLACRGKGKYSFKVLTLLTTEFTANARKLLLLQTDLISVLARSLVLSLALLVQEHATRCLYNLSTNGLPRFRFLFDAD
jgi:hypothetical protein